ncbi:hypothetical protein LINPERHAP1_LOCUS2631 [Linum perenne]
MFKELIGRLHWLKSWRGEWRRLQKHGSQY